MALAFRSRTGTRLRAVLSERLLPACSTSVGVILRIWSVVVKDRIEDAVLYSVCSPITIFLILRTTYLFSVEIVREFDASMRDSTAIMLESSAAEFGTMLAGIKRLKAKGGKGKGQGKGLKGKGPVSKG
jgi:hypothetical protein